MLVNSKTSMVTFINLEDLPAQSLKNTHKCGLCACVYRDECVCIYIHTHEHVRPYSVSKKMYGRISAAASSLKAAPVLQSN